MMLIYVTSTLSSELDEELKIKVAYLITHQLSYQLDANAQKKLATVFTSIGIKSVDIKAK